MVPPSPRGSPAIRDLVSQADYEACVALQRATWGDDFRELVPPAMLQVSAKMGGIVAGAFQGEDLIGFVFGITGIRHGRLSHWSHMLAVADPWRNRGIGQQLKDYQRRALVAVGIDRMIWTFDPLVARNAHLNLERLGAQVLEYVRDMYGDNPMSRTDSVIGSDRFVVEWILADDRAADGRVDGARGGPADRPADGQTLSRDTDHLPDAPVVLVSVPADIQTLKQHDPEEALAWRASTRRAFEHYLPRGYAVTGFARGTPGGHAAYRVERLR